MPSSSRLVAVSFSKRVWGGVCGSLMADPTWGLRDGLNMGDDSSPASRAARELRTDAPPAVDQILGQAIFYNKNIWRQVG